MPTPPLLTTIQPQGSTLNVWHHVWLHVWFHVVTRARRVNGLTWSGASDTNWETVCNKLSGRHIFDSVFLNECLPINPVTGTTNTLRTYGLIKTKSSYSSYVQGKAPFKFRKALACLRLSALPLMMEVGRYSGTPYDLRFCPVCPNCVETEAHF
jgi:hypothetical protein